MAEVPELTKGEFNDFIKQPTENDGDIFTSALPNYTTLQKSNTLYYRYKDNKIENLLVKYGLDIAGFDSFEAI